MIKFVAAFAIALSAALVVAKPAKRPLDSVSLSEFNRQTQRSVNDDAGLFLVWWLPLEAWEMNLSRGRPASDQFMAAMRKVMRPYNVIAVIDGGYGDRGPVFRGRAAIAAAISVEMIDAAGQSHALKLVEPIPVEVEHFLDELTPQLKSALGVIGNNMNFFVVPDSSPSGRLLSPYEFGALRVRKRAQGATPARDLTIDRPVDALFVPRFCANGKPAHVTWIYCPWDGKKID